MEVSGDLANLSMNYCTDLKNPFGFQIMGKLSPLFIFIGCSGKTLSLPSFSLMWDTKSLLAPLKEEEINVSVSGPKKMNVPFTFSHSLSLAGDFKKGETYLKLQESIFYTRDMEFR